MKYVFFFLIAVAFTACDRVKTGTKDAIDKTAETAGKVGSDIITKVGEGVEKSLQCEAVLNEALKKNGLQTGKMIFSSQKDATENILSMYFIFEKDFNSSVSVKAFDEKKLEYGRAAAVVKGKKGTAGYVDFVFDKKVNLESKSTFIFE